MRAIIVGSGPSAAGFKPPNGVFIIAVNGVADWIDRADCWFSLDASLKNQITLRQRRLKHCCYVTCGPWWQKRGDRHMQRVDSIDTRGKAPASWASEAERSFWRNACVATINRTPDHINTGNSAWGALGLAWHLGLRDVALIGVDASSAPRIEGGQCNDLSHLPMLFASATLDFDSLVCLGHMDAPGIPKMTLQEWLCK